VRVVFVFSNGGVVVKFKVTTIEKNGASEGTLKVGWIPVTVMVAVIGILPPIIGFGIDWIQKPVAQEASNELELAKLDLELAKLDLELAKLDLERDREAASLFRRAFSDPDSVQRKRILEFIVATNLLSPDIDTEALLGTEVPQWPAGPEESP
jgi:hypothetical protein